MKLSLRNVNKIRKADVELNGLTVIVGENDSGKSTVGRILFTIIKSLVHTNINDQKRTDELVKKYVNSFYKRLSKGEFSVVGMELSQSPFPRVATEFIREIQEAVSIDEYIKEKCEDVDSLSSSPRLKSLMKDDLNRILICKTHDNDRAASLQTVFQFVAESEFLNQLGVNNETLDISLYDEADKEIFSHRIDGSKAVTGCRDGEPLSDVVYVESPLYMHLLELLKRTQVYTETENKQWFLSPMVPYHIKDFADKLNTTRSNTMSLFSHNDYNFNSSEIVGGEFEYDKKKKSLVFKKEGMELYPLNVASGIKIFGVLQILLDSGYISAECPLVWDEPENHLHPEWQVEFAKILVQLSKSGVPVLITTHSPYFLQAIRYFSALERIEDFVNYYSAECVEGNMVDMVDVKEDLNSVFLKLATPLNKIMNVDAARQGLEL
ncbi:MAG: AAA family ATPase [Bacteroidales bacterium]|nr:AAA family ATPase [Bacteroidales bacterium]